MKCSNKNQRDIYKETSRDHRYLPPDPMTVPWSRSCMRKPFRKDWHHSKKMLCIIQDYGFTWNARIFWSYTQNNKNQKSKIPLNKNNAKIPISSHGILPCVIAKYFDQNFDHLDSWISLIFVLNIRP